MGKYMKKSKTTAELSHSCMPPVGVRTRAKTLAHGRLRNTFPNPNSSSSPSSSFGYLELRSRRLPKSPIKPRNQHSRLQQNSGEKPCFRTSPKDDRGQGGNSRLASKLFSAESAPLRRREMQRSCELHFGETARGSEIGTEGRDSEESFEGEEKLESCEKTERQAISLSMRKLIQGRDFVPSIPTSNQMEEFFAFAEQEHRRLFIKKYNFDVLTDAPLPGQFEWVRVCP